MEDREKSSSCESYWCRPAAVARVVAAGAALQLYVPRSTKLKRSLIRKTKVMQGRCWSPGAESNHRHGDFQSAGQLHANRSSRLAGVSKTLSQTAAPVNRRENLRPTVSPSTRRAPPAVAHRSRDVGVLGSGRIALGSSHAQEAQGHRQEGGQEGRRRVPRARHQAVRTPPGREEGEGPAGEEARPAPARPGRRPAARRDPRESAASGRDRKSVV